MTGKPYELPVSLHAAQVEIMVLRVALQEIKTTKPEVTRHFDGPSPADELDATVSEGEYENLQEIAEIALMVAK